MAQARNTPSKVSLERLKKTEGKQLRELLVNMAKNGQIDQDLATTIMAEVMVRTHQTRQAALKASQPEPATESDQEQLKPEQDLSPEQKEQLFSNLKTSFEANMNLHPDIEWQAVEAKLKNSPVSTLVTLNKMWERGGEPTVTAFDQKTRKYRFDDCSVEVPQHGRNTTYPQAEQMAKEMGADLMEQSYYEHEFQKLGKEFDLYSQNWLKASKEKLEAGVASSGFSYDSMVFIYVYNESDHQDNMGFRSSLWV